MSLSIPGPDHVRRLAAVLAGCLAGCLAGFADATCAAAIATILTIALLAEHRLVWLPGRLIIIWQYLCFVIIPGLDNSWTEPPWTFALVSAIAFLTHAVHACLPPPRDRAEQLLGLLTATPLRSLLGPAILGCGAIIYLISIGAFEHLAGKVTVDAPFKGVAGAWKTIFYPLLAILGLRWRSDRRARWLAILLLILAATASALSGRKEEFVLSIGILSLFGFAGSDRLTPRMVIALACAAALALGAIALLYQMRRHTFFWNPKSNAPITEVIADTIEGQNLDPNISYSLSDRLDYHEPTSRYFERGGTVVDPYEAMEIAEYTLTPGVFKIPQTVQPHSDFYFGYRYGYTGFYGDSAIASGPVVEAHNYFGWAGLLLPVFIPVLLDRLLLLFTGAGTVGFLVFWACLWRSVTYERPAWDSLLSLPILLLPPYLLALGERLLTGRDRFLSCRLGSPVEARTPPPTAPPPA